MLEIETKQSACLPVCSSARHCTLSGHSCEVVYYLAFSLSAFSKSSLKCLISSNSSAVAINFVISFRNSIIVASINEQLTLNRKRNNAFKAVYKLILILIANYNKLFTFNY